MNLESVKLLKDIEEENDDGETPLHLCSRDGNLEVVKFLLEKGVDIASKNNYGETPLHLSSENGKLEVVKFLLEKGADIESKFPFRRSPFPMDPLHELRKDKLKKGTWVSKKGKDYGITPLHMAATSGSNLEVVKFLLEKGANIESKQLDRKTPLHVAVESGDFDLVKLLLERGANIESNADGTPLHNCYNLKIANLLLEKGANIEAKDYWSKTRLHNAADGKNLEMIAFLVAKGAEINAKNRDGDTPLHMAIRSETLEFMYSDYEEYGIEIDEKKLDVVKCLVEKGADIESKNNCNESPLDISLKNRYLEVTEFFKEKKIQVAQKKIQYFFRKITAKNISNKLRMKPHNLFDPEFSCLRKKILKIDDSRFKSGL